MSENGTRQPPLGERGVSLPDHLAAGTALPYSIRYQGLQDWTKPTSRDLDKALASDGQMQALDYALTLPIGGAKLRIEGEGAEADFVRENLLASEYAGGMVTPLSGVIEQMASAVTLKRAFFEKVWKVEGNRTRLEKLKFLPISTCDIVPDARGEFDGFIQRGFRTDASLSGVRFKPDKAFVYIHHANRKPLEGRSVLQTAWHDYEHKVKVRHLNHLHLQLYALGIKKGTSGSEKQKDHESLLSRMNTTSGGGSMILGPGEAMDIVTAGTSSEFNPYLEYLDRQMAVSALAQWLQLGSGGSGGAAYALSRDHSDFFTQAIDATLREMGETLTRYVVAPLVAYNFGSGARKKLPQVKLGPVSENDVSLAVELFKDLSTAPASRVPDEAYEKIQKKALSAMDIEVEESSGD